MKEQKAREKIARKEHIADLSRRVIELEEKNRQLDGTIRDLKLIVFDLENRLNAFSSIKHLEMDEIK